MPAVLKKTKFDIISSVPDLGFEYRRARDGSYYTFASDIELDRAEDAEFIKITERNAPYIVGKFAGDPEPVLNGHIKILQPSETGEDLIEVKIGTFKCVRCGEVGHIEQEPKKFIEPVECFNDACGRRGQFKPLWDRDLSTPVWKLPYAALECSPIGVYNDIVEYIKEYLILRPEEYHLMALWIMASYLVDDFKTVPYLLFIAPKESGKSQAMRILDLLAYRAFLAASVTPPSLFRAIENWKVTLLIDEAEYQIKQDTESGQALYASLNMGYKRGSYALRTEGETRTPTAFDVFGFKAIASTKVFLATLESRSIIINMTQGVPKKIILDEQRAEILRSELLYFKFTNVGRIPIMQPKSKSGRIIEIMTPLYTIAEIFKGLDGIKSDISYDGIIKILNDKIKELEDKRSDEEHESHEAMVIEAIQNIRQDSYRDEPEYIKLKEIARSLNWINDADQQNTKEVSARIGRIIKAMGIGTHRRKDGVCLDLNNKDVVARIDEMIIRYLENK